MNWTCEKSEERLSDYLEGLLGPDELRALAEHTESCARCRALAERVRNVMTALHRVEPVTEPPGLIHNILEQTLGPRVPKKAWGGWLGWLQPALQPRVAMGFATLVLFGVVSLQALGVQLTKIRPSDMNPLNLVREGNRRAHLIYARGAKFVNDLRVVYEIQSRLRPETEQQPQQRPPQQQQQQPNPQDKRNRESNRLNQPAYRFSSLAMILGHVPGRSLQ